MNSLQAYSTFEATISECSLGEDGAWLWRLMDHMEERQEEETEWREFGEVVVDVMEEVGLVGGDQGRWSRDEVYKAGGVVRTNAYSIEVQGEGKQFGSVRVLFPLLSLRTTTQRSFQRPDYRV